MVTIGDAALAELDALPREQRPLAPGLAIRAKFDKDMLQLRGEFLLELAVTPALIIGTSTAAAAETAADAWDAEHAAAAAEEEAAEAAEAAEAEDDEADAESAGEAASE